MSAPEERAQKPRTLADVYAERTLTAAQVRRIVTLLRLTERGGEQSTREAA